MFTKFFVFLSLALAVPLIGHADYDETSRRATEYYNSNEYRELLRTQRVQGAAAANQNHMKVINTALSNNRKLMGHLAQTTGQRTNEDGYILGVNFSTTAGYDCKSSSGGRIVDCIHATTFDEKTLITSYGR